MKILIASDVLGEPNNGTSMATFNLVNALRDRGHEVRIMCPDKERKGEKDFFVLPTLNFGKFINEYIERNGVRLAKADPKVMEAALDGVDEVHVMLPFSASCKLVAMANKRNIPISAGFHCQAENFTSHVGLMWSHLATRLVYKHFWRKCYHSVDCIHYPTEFIKNDFEKVAGPTNAYVISNGIKPFYHRLEVEKPEEYKNKFLIVMTGRYVKEKRQDILINALKYSRFADKIQLIFPGSGPKEKKLRKLSKHLKNQPIFGFHNQDELRDILNYSDLYVHTAYAELESISALEAITCGLVPIINASKRSATKYYAIDELNLFEQNNPKSLAKKIDYWLSHPEDRKVRSNDYLNYTKRFEFNHCMNRMEKMVKEAVDVRRYKVEHNLHHRIVYYKDPLNDDFAGTTISQKKVDDSFVYVHENKLWRTIGTIFYFGIAYPILFLLVKIKRHVKVKNKKVLKKVKKSGYFLYGNHTNIYDAFIPHTQVSRFKKTYIIANPDAVSIKGVKNLVMMLGALPTPSSPQSVKNFNAAIEKRIAQKRAIVIYPEAHIWPFYRGLRPFSDISFQYPAKLNAPVIAMVTTYRKAKIKINKKRRPYINITLSEPIYPNPELSLRENMRYLRDSVYNFMKETIESSGSPEYINYVQASPDSTKFEI